MLTSVRSWFNSQETHMAHCVVWTLVFVPSIMISLCQKSPCSLYSFGLYFLPCESSRLGGILIYDAVNAVARAALDGLCCDGEVSHAAVPWMAPQALQAAVAWMAVETVDAAVLERIIKAQGAPVRKTFLDTAITASCVPDGKHNERFSDVQIFDQAGRCGFHPAVHNWGRYYSGTFLKLVWKFRPYIL